MASIKSSSQSPVVLTGENLAIDDVVAVARRHAPVACIADASSAVKERMEKSAAWVRGAIDDVRRHRQEGTKPPAFYGINTGFGHLAGRAAFVNPDDAQRLSRNLIVSHSVCVGDYFEEDVVRAAMLIRANTLAKGFSGVRSEVIDTLINMLNKGVYPAVPKKGSVGASGDLAPLAHLALVMSRPSAGPDDERESGEAFVPGEHSGRTIVSGKEAMQRAGIDRIVLGAKEGLALNNGATFSAAMAALTVYDADNLVENAEIALAMTLEAMRGFRDPYFPQVHQARTHPGQGITAQRVLRLVQGSSLLDGDQDSDPEQCPPQDPYSLRCAPQVIGAVRDTLGFVRGIIEAEINAATDNPLIFTDLPRAYKAVSCGNFHGEPLAFAMDFTGIVMSELGNIAERRIFQLVDYHQRPGESEADALPPRLLKEDAAKEGLNSGFIMPQYTAAALVSDCKTLAHPDSVDSIPTGGTKEDHVSMSTNAARHAGEIVWNIQQVIAIELLCAAQALDFRVAAGAATLGAGTQAAHDHIRTLVTHLDGDRVLYPDMRRMATLVQSGDLVQQVWRALDTDGAAHNRAEISAIERQIAYLQARKQRYER
jgi:histidine ammonia-lyase